MASVRAVVPGAVADDAIARPLAPGFAAYPASAFELVLDAATALDAAAKTVTVALSGDAAAEGGHNTTRTITYDALDAAMP
jgi:NADH dehydrogenase FAD-containing subunit